MKYEQKSVEEYFFNNKINEAKWQANSNHGSSWGVEKEGQVLRTPDSKEGHHHLHRGPCKLI